MRQMGWHGQRAGPCPAGDGSRTIDLLQLSGLAAAASNAASSTACAVDAVVKEAVLFFTTMPDDRRDLAQEGGEVYKVYSQRAHADARGAADACALAHQLVARASVGEAMSVALAAGRVCAHADRTAATAREGAQQCMRIIEDAVQANASPLSRETAKRCAEQALLSIEAASLAEQHSRSLWELLARSLGATEVRQAAQTLRPCPAQASSASRPGQLNASSSSASSAAPRQRRWWDEFPAVGNTQMPAQLTVDSIQEGLGSSEQLHRHLQACMHRCAESRAWQDGRISAEQDEDKRALRAIIEWRYSQASACCIAEEELLSDADACRMAIWRRSERLPQDLMDCVRRCPGLCVSLRAAMVVRARSEEVRTQVQEEVSTGAHAERDLDLTCDRLGWVKICHRVHDGTQVDVFAGLDSWERQTRPLEAQCRAVLEGDWSVDAVSLRQLHAFSMRSRASKQRRQAGSVDRSVDEPARVRADKGPETCENDDLKVRATLAELLGDWEVVKKPTEWPPPTADQQASKVRVRKKRQPAAADSPTAVSSFAAWPAPPTPTAPSPNVRPGPVVSPVHRLVEPQQLIQTAVEMAMRSTTLGHARDDSDGEQGDEDHTSLAPGGYYPGRMLQRRLPRTFQDSMGHIAQERREAYGMPPWFGLGDWASPAYDAIHRERFRLRRGAWTFNEGITGPLGFNNSPIGTPAGTFIATPTSSDSGELGPLRDNRWSPVYIQAPSTRWVSERFEGFLATSDSGGSL